jgi:hypothetical protein
LDIALQQELLATLFTLQQFVVSVPPPVTLPFQSAQQVPAYTELLLPEANPARLDGQQPLFTLDA